MIFTMDIGNTNIKMGLFKDSELIHYWRLATKLTNTASLSRACSTVLD